MTVFLIIISVISAIILLPKVTFLLKLFMELAIIAFYVVALAIIAVITIRSHIGPPSGDGQMAVQESNESMS